MPEIRRRFDPEFGEGAVRIVRETKKPRAVIARDLGVNPGTLGNWVDKDKAARGEGDGPSASRMRRNSSGSAARTPNSEWNGMSSSDQWSCVKEATK